MHPYYFKLDLEKRMANERRNRQRENRKKALRRRRNRFLGKRNGKV
ncbi:MAG: hypothetical protein BWY78_00298 [Alphaproteobacteria bacterium ADurb.Bin438]|nr:MAG: hypothetical protein BWY78_00298 [Alphaproteobacteria bacterium ADurb.Bin438]